jgi:hypothetical protein
VVDGVPQAVGHAPRVLTQAYDLKCIAAAPLAVCPLIEMASVSGDNPTEAGSSIAACAATIVAESTASGGTLAEKSTTTEPATMEMMVMSSVVQTMPDAVSTSVNPVLS